MIFTILFGSVFNSFAQDAGKGCQHGDVFYVQPSNLVPNPNDDLVWFFLDDFGAGPYGLESNTLYWFRNDVAVDTVDFSSYYYLGFGGCGGAPTAGSTLSTKVTGNYELRFIGSYKTVLPIIKIVDAPKAEIIESESEIVHDFSIFPNPAQESINVNHGDITEGIARIYDNNGRLIETFILNNTAQSTLINVSTIRNGNYIYIECRSRRGL